MTVRRYRRRFSRRNNRARSVQYEWTGLFVDGYLAVPAAGALLVLIDNAIMTDNKFRTLMRTRGTIELYNSGSDCANGDVLVGVKAAVYRLDDAAAVPDLTAIDTDADDIGYRQILYTNLFHIPTCTQAAKDSGAVTRHIEVDIKAKRKLDDPKHEYSILLEPSVANRLKFNCNLRALALLH